MDKLTKIVILGDTGFIGSHLKTFLKVHLPMVEILGISTRHTDLTNLEQVMELQNLLDENSTVIMCSMLKREMGDSNEIFAKNMQMINHLAQMLKEVSIAKLIYFSSTAIFGEDIHNEAIVEETAVAPRTFYGLAKLNAEFIFNHLFENQSEKLVILRPPVIYGPGDRSKTYGPTKFIDHALKNEILTLWGDGTEKREFIFIEDVCQVILQLLMQDKGGSVNLVSGQNYQFQQIISFIENITQEKLEIDSRPRTKKQIDHGFINKKLHDFCPKFEFTPLAKGIEKTILVERESLS